MKWFLVVYIFVNGQWEVGDQYDGWGAIQQPNQEICATKRDYANDINDPEIFKFECEQRSPMEDNEMNWQEAENV